MSRIGKMPVLLPKGVTANIQGSTITIKGPRGELKQTFHSDMTLRQEDSRIARTVLCTMPCTAWSARSSIIWSRA